MSISSDMSVFIVCLPLVYLFLYPAILARGTLRDPRGPERLMAHREVIARLERMIE